MEKPRLQLTISEYRSRVLHEYRLPVATTNTVPYHSVLSESSNTSGQVLSLETYKGSIVQETVALSR
jgi:hypothetical protein